MIERLKMSNGGNLTTLWRKIKPGRELGSLRSGVAIFCGCSEKASVVGTLQEDDGGKSKRVMQHMSFWGEMQTVTPTFKGIPLAMVK